MKSLCNALTVAGIKPARLYEALEEIVDLQVNEEQTMSRYGLRLTREAEVRHATIWKLMEVIDDEMGIHKELHRKLKLKGLN